MSPVNIAPHKHDPYPLKVLRVYVGSFWDEPLMYDDNEALFDMEERDLMNDLRELPRNSAVRKINELVKRCRLAKVSKPLTVGCS